MGTASARSLGVALRKIRIGTGDERNPQWTLDEAALGIDAHKSTVSRIERGLVAARPKLVDALVRFYGVEDRELADSIRQLARAGQRQDWWTGYRDILHPQFRQYLGLEAEASSLHSWEPGLIPGLLQTAEYVAALAAAYRRESKEVDRVVEARIERQSILQGPSPSMLYAVVGEAALHRMIGGKQVTLAQLNHLAQAAGRANVRVQVVPHTAGAYMPEVGGFQVLRFADSEAGEVVCVETLSRTLYIDDRDEVELYRAAWEDVLGVAVPHQESIQMIKAAAEELK